MNYKKLDPSIYMPYITEQRKRDLKYIINTLQNEKLNIGEINYIMTMLIQHYINTNGTNYSTLNESIGVLECSKLELYRRLVSSYEDIKIHQNGDVYP